MPHYIFYNNKIFCQMSDNGTYNNVFFFYYVDAVKVSALCFVVFAVVRMLICNDLTIGF